MLERDFFARPTLAVARDLLGQHLVRELNGHRLSGLIVETEAYIGPADTANHASKGRTPRTEVMFGPPGHAYVYFVYGMYDMLNLVTEPAGFPAAVLIRAIEPLEGVEMMHGHRSSRLRFPASSRPHLTNGPAKLCQALAVNRALNGWDVCQGRRLWLEATPPPPDEAVAAGPRIGIAYAHPTDRAAPWRFWLRGSTYVSR
jgi:DNA-3-methyladenine glycosylase